MQPQVAPTGSTPLVMETKVSLKYEVLDFQTCNILMNLISVNNLSLINGKHDQQH